MEKPYDMKKSCWVVNKGEDGGYLEGLVQKDMMVADWEAKGSKLDINVNGEVKNYKIDQVCQMNPPKFDCSEDMADLTYLGDACVLWNSSIRLSGMASGVMSSLFTPLVVPI